MNQHRDSENGGDWPGPGLDRDPGRSLQINRAETNIPNIRNDITNILLFPNEYSFRNECSFEHIGVIFCLVFQKFLVCSLF